MAAPRLTLRAKLAEAMPHEVSDEMSWAASVLERIKEIGLRRALGATQWEIMLQFILEAALLSLLGGTTALGVVHGLTVVVSDTFELPYQFESKTAALALGSAVLVGVGAGFPPALRASQIDPVKALRSQ